MSSVSFAPQVFNENKKQMLHTTGPFTGMYLYTCSGGEEPQKCPQYR